MGVSAILDAYSRRSLSPVDVMRSVIDRVERCEPHVKALFAFDPESALDNARASETRWMRREARALDGVPATLKENIATRGTPMPLGTAARPLDPAPDDAPPAARLREAGAILFAKTTMPDYGMLSSGLSSFHPLTRNPWDLTKNPGGSSAGAAAAAALGYGPLHLGTDIGGSIRLPAGWCGIFGLKPSLGRIPIDPPTYGRVAGPMTRRVEDAAHMMRVLSLPDVRDPMSLPFQEIPWLDLGLDLEGMRLGLMMEAGIGLLLDSEVREKVEDAARLFEAAGAIVEPMPPFLTRQMLDGLDRFWRQRAWMDVKALSSEQRDKVLPYIRSWAESGRDLSGEQVYEGMHQMMAMRQAAVAACRPYAFVLSPVSPVAAFAAELASPIDDPMRPFEHIAYTVAFNMSEQPAASINCGYTKTGLPIGLQIIGQRFDDLGVLRLSRVFEALRPPQRPWPAM
jgi:Asp-tRNA(Asn)/Glu-tRNA(Gln) amidotransferase A subunit family amidase